AVITATITITTTVTASAGTPFANLAAGMKVKMSGFTNAANNGTFTIVTWTSATVIVLAGLVNEGPTSNVVISAGGVAKGSATLTTTTLTFGAGSPIGNVVAGQWVLIAGCTNSGNNGAKQVVSATSTV